MMVVVVVLLVLMALCCGSGHSSNLKRPLWYHSDPASWQDARDVCQSEHGGDLLTVLSQDELDFMNLTLYHAWTGRVLHSSHFHWGSTKGDRAFGGLFPDAGDHCAYTTYRKNSMDFSDCNTAHFFFCSGFNSISFVPQTKSWTDARYFCGYQLHKLFNTFSSLDLPTSPIYQPQEFPVWVGLYSNDLDSAPSSVSGDCASVGSLSKSMSTHACSDAYPFVCSNKNLVLLQEVMIWEQAVDKCKTLSSTINFMLLSVDQKHMETIKNVLRFAQTEKVWVGLRFLAGSWFWSDKTTVPLPSLPSCPGFTLGCGALVLSSGSDPVIEPTDCTEKLNLLCYDPALYL